MCVDELIKNWKVPGKRDSEKCILAIPCLANRGWKDVKNFVKNFIDKLKRANSKSSQL